VGCDKIKEGELGGHITTMEEKGSAHKILVGELEGTRLLPQLRLRWEDTIK
jgi:hypothetical protein